MPGKFAALSYCWGPESQLKTNPRYKLTTATMAELQSESGVPLDQMPQTLQDSIILCRDLGISYIWIDALCIVQAQGANDYSKSHFTIIAAAADSCHSGLPQFATHKHAKTVTSPQALPRHVRLVARRHRNCPSGFHASELDSLDPISKRGWTYQEELLSTRYVKFTENHVQWRCRSSAQCMCGQGLDLH
ncbi:hypothetical protein B0H66DRAFT_466066 [Apodospora peruviana]|uniref:Heterokaryon incompatibility domain-containing protein n=1 Tax=Apodospora peruviana TaxID=516989 RepID=A0AAE0IQC8_9PEZI|nr:hypothetical protein B0H66DRAFT_466066 [Apodospora peruviana]